jgi:hypothetical protein
MSKLICEECGRLDRTVRDTFYYNHCECGNRHLVCSDCYKQKVKCITCKREEKIEELI